MSHVVPMGWARWKMTLPARLDRWPIPTTGGSLSPRPAAGEEFPHGWRLPLSPRPFRPPTLGRVATWRYDVPRTVEAIPIAPQSSRERSRGNCPHFALCLSARELPPLAADAAPDRSAMPEAP